MVCKSNKIDSNMTELRYAEEECLRKLPASPVWYPLEPNSYSDFGGQLTTVAREPISPSRQKRKGVVTDLEASGGFNQDLTVTNILRLMQGFMFADARQKASTAPYNGARAAVGAVTAGTKTIVGTGMPVFKKGALVQLTGFTATANKGLFTVAADSTATALTTVEALVDDAASDTAEIHQVGVQLDAGAVNAAMNGKLFRLVRGTGTLDFRTLGLIPGEWVFIGGDSATSKLPTCVGFARVGSVAESFLEFDKVAFDPKAESGAGKSVQIFFGTVIKNEKEIDLIKRRSYQLERYLGKDANGKMSEYLVGACPNEFTLTINQADKATFDMSFVAMDNEQRDGTAGMKAGDRPTLLPEDAFNTSSDFSRIKMSSVVDDSAPDPLFAFVTELSLTINNNITGAKAVGVLGAIDTNAGMFDVGGKTTAYFADVKAAQAVRNNADVTIDVIMLKRNAGLVWDIPLLTLGDGRLNVEKDNAITIPLDTNAVESKFGHTLLLNHFPYLPNVAGGV